MRASSNSSRTSPHPFPAGRRYQDGRWAAKIKSSPLICPARCIAPIESRISSFCRRLLLSSLSRGRAACEHQIDCIINALHGASRYNSRKRAIDTHNAVLFQARAFDSVKFVSPLSSETKRKTRRRRWQPSRLQSTNYRGCRSPLLLLYTARAWLTILTLLRNIRFGTRQSRGNKTSDLTI